VTRAVLVLALVACAWGVLHVGWYARDQIVDYGVYQRYGDAVAHDHAVPYRDFAVEYPPAALPVFVVPAWYEGFGYRTAFKGLMAICLAAAALGALAVGGLRAGVLTAVAPLALGSVVVSRFDLWPAALTVLALAALLRGGRTTSAVLLGTAFAAKLWPALLVPLLFVWLFRRIGRGAALKWLLLVAGTAATWFLPFVALSPGGVAHSFHAQLARPLQLESLGAAVLVAGHHVLGYGLGWSSSHGSQNVDGTGAAVAAVATSLVQLGLLAWLWARFARGPADAERLVRHAAAALAVFVAFGKVLSPQFLIWLIPVVPLVAGRRGLRAGGLLALACALTQVWFPRRYWDYVYTFDGVASAAVLGRDLALVALVAVLLGPTARGRAPARSP